MRKFGGMLAALALATSALAGCSQGGSAALAAVNVDPKSIEAEVTKLAADTGLKGTMTTPAKLELVRDMLPKEVKLSWASLTFDAATNSTLVTDLKLTPSDTPTVGVQVAELRLWDFDADLLKARVSGQRLTETAKLARRIDAKNISVFGLAEAINHGSAAAMQDMTTEPPPPIPASPTKFQPTDPTAPAAAPEDWPPNTEPDFGMTMSVPTVKRMDITLARMIIDDVQLRPYQVTPAPPATPDPNDPMASGLSALQQMVSVMQSYGIDTAAYFDYKVAFEVEEAGQTVGGNATVKSMGARGMRGGDLDGMFIRDVDYSFTAPTAPGAAPFDFKYKLGLMTLKDLRLEKALGYLVKGVMPPRTETNLMGLGIWRSENDSLSLAGQEIYTAAETTFDGTGFHWFIPTKLEASGKNISLNLSALMDIGLKYSTIATLNDQPADPDAAAAVTAEIQQAKSLLEKNGLGKVTFDTGFGWNWNAQNGDTKLDLSFASKDLLDVGAKYEGGFPSFKAVSDVIPETGEPNEMAIANVFQTNSSLKLIDLNVKDNGGLTKIFGMIGDVGPSMGGPQMTGDQVRAQAVEGIKMLADPATTGIPELATLLLPVADFLATGGKLHVGVQPAKPMPFGSLVGTLMSAGMGAPAQAIKELGLKVEHSK